MTVPDFQSLTLPVLRLFKDNDEHPSREIRDALAQVLALSDEALQERLPSGVQTRFANRVAWSLVYLVQSGLLESKRRGVYRITSRGQGVLADPPDKLTVKYLKQFPELLSFLARGAAAAGDEAATADSVLPSSDLTPDEQVLRQFGAAP